MAHLLLDLSLRGSLVLILVLALDQVTARMMTTTWRRVWWLLVPLAFLIPVHFSPVLPAPVSAPIQNTYQTYVVEGIAPLTNHWERISSQSSPKRVTEWLALLWLGGIAVNFILILVPTWKVHRRWSRERFSTDPALLNLLEDCKGIAGITAPIGLIISDKVTAPALLGWLRPRILLPPSVAQASSDELRGVLLHELAHFKLLDIPLNWLFTAARVIHWFNPLAWLASTRWTHFREEAADEHAIRWMNESNGTAYGEILLKTLGKCSGGSTPYGALAIGESINNLKRRILMIRSYTSKSSRGWMASLIILILGLVMALSPSMGEEDADAAAKKDAVAAMQTWLAGIDGGGYAKSWTDASKAFQKAVTSDQWVAALNGVRTPLGKSLERKLSSALHQTAVPTPGGGMLKGDYVIVQFDSSYENLKSALETVTFEKEADGVWRASGYYVKPN